MPVRHLSRNIKYTDGWMSMEFVGRVQAGKINVGVISVETTFKTNIHQ